jgi:hypothetical protein
MTYSEFQSKMDRGRLPGILYWLILLPFTIRGLRATVINGIQYPLKYGHFYGDFSSALFDVRWVNGRCHWSGNALPTTVGSVQNGTFERPIEIFYGPVFTLAQHLSVESICPPFTLISTPKMDVVRFLYVITIINLGLIFTCVLLIAKLLSRVDARSLNFFWLFMVIATLWVSDTHLSYSLAVAAIPELLELCLLLSVALLMIRPKASTQIAAGALVGFSAMIKLIPVVFIPLMVLRRRYTSHRLASLIGTVTVISIATSLILDVSLSKVVRQSFIPVGRFTVTPTTHDEFRSLSSGLSRILDIETTARTGTILGAMCLIIVFILCLVSVMFTITLRRRANCWNDSEISSVLLLIGLYSSLLPMIGIVHRHTYIFLIPVYAITYYAASNLFTGKSALYIGIFGGLLYLWSSQSLILMVWTQVGIPIHDIIYEEALPNIGFTLLFIAMIYFKEIRKKIPVSNSEQI